VSRVVLRLAIAGTLCSAAGCFDVQRVSQGPWVIDDFEDGDLKPTDRNFGPWGCASFNESTTTNCSYGRDPGDDSAYSLFLDFTVEDSPDGVAQQGGAQLQTEAAKPEDLSRFNQMVLSVKLVSGSPPLPSSAQVFVQLNCSSAQADNGSSPGDLYLLQYLPYTSDWQTFPLAMANFTSPSFTPMHVLGGPMACLERVDGISFSVAPQVAESQSATGRLNVDHIYFQ
jgi:hypothetical protein